MVRAAAKNHRHVGVVTNPEQYEAVLTEITTSGSLSDATRHELARAAFAHTATYDADVAKWFNAGAVFGGAPSATDAVVPSTLHLSLERAEVTRYGENPHQVAARYRVSGTTPWWDGVTQHAGSALSYLNFFDADAAWRLVHELASDVPGRDAVAIIKHANASGQPSARHSETPFRRPSRPIRRAPSAASSRSTATWTLTWPPSSPPVRKPTS